jgi:hypothetical protein
MKQRGSEKRHSLIQGNRGVTPMVVENARGIRAGWTERAGIIAGSLIPIVGVLALGWDAGPILLFLWLDGWLGIGELGAVACAAVVRESPQVLPPPGKPIQRAFTWGFAYLFITLILSIPSILAWLFLMSATQRQYPDGLWIAAVAIPGTAFSLGLNIVLRTIQAVSAARRKEEVPVSYTIEEKYHLLVFKIFGMLFLASILKHPGYYGLILYVVLLSAFLGWAEWEPGVVLHILKVPRRSR